MTILELIKAQCGVQGVDKKHAERIEKISGITEEKDGNIIAAVKKLQGKCPAGNRGSRR